MGNFGGKWTLDKLDMVEDYLDAYTTALKHQPFRLIYIDAFAGTGIITLQRHNGREQQFVEGSAIRAKDVVDRCFDEILLVENDPRRHAELNDRMNAYHDHRIHVLKDDANYFLKNLSRDWRKCRGVLFLDPFATEVEWGTIERVASLKALDIWMLFPTMAIMRLLPRRGPPKEKHGAILTRVFGNTSWETLYRRNPQLTFLDDDIGKRRERSKGAEDILELYKTRLRDLYGDRFMAQSATLHNSKNRPLFELIFCVGHPGKTAITIAKNIARHIVMSKFPLHNGGYGFLDSDRTT